MFDITLQVFLRFRKIASTRPYARNTDACDIQSSENRGVDGNKMIYEETVFLTTVNDCRRHSLIIILLPSAECFRCSFEIK